MGHPGGVKRDRLEGHGEAVFIIVEGHVQMPGAGGQMLKFEDLRLYFPKGETLAEQIAVIHPAHGQAVTAVDHKHLHI